jgi:hypothetical protein
MKCKENGCNGIIEHGVCNQCGVSVDMVAARSVGQSVIETLKIVLTPKEVAPTKEELSSAASKLAKVAPYNYDAWRLHADLLLNALSQLQSRQLQPDASFTILTIPLREDDLRDAAELALRQCAHFADGAERRIAAIDEANRVRRETWF